MCSRLLCIALSLYLTLSVCNICRMNKRIAKGIKGADHLNCCSKIICNLLQHKIIYRVCPFQISAIGTFSLSGQFLHYYTKLFPSIEHGIKDSVVFAPMWNFYDITKEGIIMNIMINILMLYITH